MRARNRPHAHPKFVSRRAKAASNNARAALQAKHSATDPSGHVSCIATKADRKIWEEL
jgi:hypothetical protein